MNINHVKAICLLILIGTCNSCYEEFSYEELDWDKQDAMILVNGEHLVGSIRSVTYKDNPVYSTSLVFFFDGLRYEARIQQIPKSTKKISMPLNYKGGIEQCNKNCAVTYGTFEEHDVASATYRLDTTQSDHFVILEDASRKEISVSFKMKLIREEGGIPATSHLGLSSIEIGGQISDIPLRRFE